MTDTKTRFKFRDTLYNGKKLPKIKKQVLESCILISYTNTNKEHTNRDKTIPNHSNFLQWKHQIGDTTVYYKSCFENDIKFINDLTNNDGIIYTYDELKATYNVTINFLQYSGLVRSIVAKKKTLNLAYIRHKEVNPIIAFSIQVYLKVKKKHKIWTIY